MCSDLLSQLAMFNKEKEIGRLNVLNARSATKTFRNSIILEELEANSIADFLRQLSLDEENRRRTEEEELNRQNADVLDAISKLVSATQARAEEQRRKAEEAERLRLAKLEQERLKVFLPLTCTEFRSKNMKGKKRSDYDAKSCWRPSVRAKPRRRRLQLRRDELKSD